MFNRSFKNGRSGIENLLFSFGFEYLWLKIFPFNIYNVLSKFFLYIISLKRAFSVQEYRNSRCQLIISLSNQ